MLKPNPDLDINTADFEQLREECKRLGIHALRLNTLQMAHRLSSYARDYTIYLQWCHLAEMLYGSNHGIITESVETVIQGIYDELCRRLIDDGYVHPDGKGKPIEDSAHDQIIRVTSRQNTRALNVITRRPNLRIASANLRDILNVAALAFPDVAETVAEWETWKKE